MNALAPIRTRTEPSRIKFTVDVVDAMIHAGVIPPDARIELIDGDLIEMATEGARTSIIKSR